MTFSPETVQRLLRLLPFLQPVFKALSTSFYELEHADEIAARNKLEADWKAKEAGYQQQIAGLQTTIDSDTRVRQGMMEQIAARDTIITDLHVNADKLAKDNQELNDQIKAKETAIHSESDDAALRSNL